MSAEASANRAAAYVFPPALVRMMREQVAPSSESLLEVTDDDLVLLFTTIFFAGLETHEGEHYPVSVAFLGHSRMDYVVSESGATDVPPLYRWKIMRFASPRPFVSRELVKLAVAGGDRRIYSAVGVLDDGQLEFAGSLGTVGAERMIALADAPPVIASAADEIDHLPQVLPNLCSPEPMVWRIEAELPDLPVTKGPDFGPGIGPAGERIVRGNRVILAVRRTINVDPQDRAQEVVNLLPG